VVVVLVEMLYLTVLMAHLAVVQAMAELLEVA
jgi:hypothetical protein